MYQAVYKCRLCGEEFSEDTNLIADKIIGIDFERKILIILIDTNMETHNLLIRNHHECVDGSLGIVDLQGFKKAEEQPMHINKAETRMMDISRFVNESKQGREYRDYIIETENYVLMKKELYEELEMNGFVTSALRKMRNKSSED